MLSRAKPMKYIITWITSDTVDQNSYLALVSPLKGMKTKSKNIFLIFISLFIFVIVITWSLHIYWIGTTPLFFRESSQKMFKHNIMLAITTNDNTDVISTINSLNSTHHEATIYIFLNGNVTNFDFISNISVLYAGIHVVTLEDYGDHGSYVRRIMNYFILSWYDVLVFVDSGMIISVGWWEVILKLLKFTPGVFSLYRIHSNVTNARDCINDMCRDTSLEITGTVWNQDIVQQILSNINSSSDFKWADWCRSNNMEMHSLTNSLLTYNGIPWKDDIYSSSWPKSTPTINNSITKFYYEPFVVKRPYFLSGSDSFIFNFSENMDVISQISDKRLLRGMIEIKPNATYDIEDDCGYRGNYSRHFVQDDIRQNKPKIHFAKLCPLLVPEGHTFQHFLDGVLPKLAQAYKILQKHKDMYFLFPNIIRSSMVYEIWKEFGFSKKQIISHRAGRKYRADLLFLICKTPPMHPQLWLNIRKILKVHNDCKKDKIILLSRTGVDQNKPSRYILNQGNIYKKLIAEYNDKVVLFRFNDYPSLSKVRELFCQAQYVIGSHGGAMYNILFAPASATLIEYMPTNKDTGAPPGGIAHTIFWMLSYHIGQAYWRIPDTSHGFNVFIDWSNLLSILKPNYTSILQ